jgi:putative membrane protein
MTFASSLERTPIASNKLIWLLAALFTACWTFGWFYNLNLENWIIENLLVIICLSILVVVNRKLQLSDCSMVCIFLFVMLHIYGAFYAYTNNAFGKWLQDTYHLQRNPYDRIVHFSFGFFMAYPFREILKNKFKVRGRALWLLPIEIAFSLGTIFEMIEWGVAELTDSETGETYVATQGDVWDAHKDIALAAVGAALTMTILFLAKKRQAKRLGNI